MKAVTAHLALPRIFPPDREGRHRNLRLHQDARTALKEPAPSLQHAENPVGFGAGTEGGRKIAKFERTEYWKRKFPRMINHLQKQPSTPNCVRMRHRPKSLSRRSCAAAKESWTPERRPRQASLIRNWQPWGRSTGPKTEAGKARCARNPLRHGGRSRDWLCTKRRARETLRLAAANLAAIRTFSRLCRARSAQQSAALSAGKARAATMLGLEQRALGFASENLSPSHPPFAAVSLIPR